MSDAVLVNPREYDVDLHDVYAAFMGYFERKGFQWWNHSFASYFTSFNDFLAFGWGAIVVTDKRTGRGHVAVRSTNGDHPGGGGAAQGGTVQQFARMVKVRFGESLPKLANQLPIDPFESKPRLVRIINDTTTYKRLQATIPSAELNARRSKLRAGDPGEVLALWTSRNHTFLALEVEWWEKGNGVVLEAGVAAVRCRNIDALESWPPIPDDNYRRSHYVVSEWLDKRTNTNHHMPSMPRSYAHGESQSVSMSALEKILNATISTLSSPESDSQPNTLVIVSIGDSSRLHDLRGVYIPANVMVIDLPHFERALYRAQTSGSNSPQSAAVSIEGPNGGLRHHLSRSLTHVQQLPARDQSHLLSLRGMLAQLSIPTPQHVPLSNSGNAAFYVLLAFHMLVDKDCVPPAVLKQHNHQHQGTTPAYAGYPTHPNHPQMQIYPPAGHHAQPHVPNRQAGARHSGPPVANGYKRSVTMYWDDPQPFALGAAPLNNGSAGPVEGRRSGDLSGSMGRMTVNGPSGRGTRPVDQTRRTSGDRP